MTPISLETIEILNHLIEINNDRIAAYRLALRNLQVKDQDLAPLFLRMIDDSVKNNRQLAHEVDILGGEVQKGTSLEGKIYRAWMNVKTAFTGKTKQHILENCQISEEATLDSYRTANKYGDLPDFLKEIISNQLDVLLHSHDNIKRMTEVYKNA